jgi:hypothetical protein
MTNPRATVIVSARRRGSVVLYVVIAIMVAGMAASIGAQPTASGKIAAVVFFGLIIALCLGTWAMANQGRNRIEVNQDAITYRHGGRRGTTSLSLRRNKGAGQPSDLRLIPRLSDHGFKASARLTVVGSGTEIGLFRFNRHAVERACEAGGWQFGKGSPEQAAGDLLAWYESGRVIEGAQLVELFGPYDWNATADATTSLGAAVLEAYADQLAVIDPAAARAAYLRAAAAQRSYAAYATSGGEGIARMSEADRLTAKAG